MKYHAKRETGTMSITIGLVGLLMGAMILALPRTGSAVIMGEYSIAPAHTLSGIDSCLAAAPDGSIWFTEPVYNRVARITREGHVTVFALPGFGDLTGGITAGPDGNMWVARGGVVLRITSEGSITEFPLPIGDATRITSGPDGNLWFTGGNRIGRMTTDGEVTYFDLPLASSAPVGITAGPDGNLWFVEIAANQIGRITPAGVLTEFPVLTPVPPGMSQLFSITSGPDGNLWFTMSGKIGRITPTGEVTEFAMSIADSYCYGITMGADGNIWFAINNRSKIGRITPSGVFLAEISTPSQVSAPQHITASPDGLIWFTESNTNKIGLISLDDVGAYFPLTSSYSWTYRKNGVDGFMRSISAGTFNINGINTKLIQDSDGYQAYYTNDGNGIREHREYDPATVTTVTLNPPLIFANAQSALGSPLNSLGTASGSQGGYPFSLSYSASSTNEALEIVTVPAGTFATARISTSLSVDGMMSIQTNWVAKDVGAVKTVEGGDTYLLTATNVLRTEPDTFWFNDQLGVDLNTMITSNPISVTGITSPAIISITGGEYKIDSRAYTGSSGTVTNGQNVTVRQTSSSDFSSKSAAVLTIGGVSAKFIVWTRPRPADADLAKAILVLKVLAGIPGLETLDISDVSGDGKVGLEEVVYILQKVSGLRQ